MRKFNFTIFFIINIPCLVIILNNVFILYNKNIKILFDNRKIILYFLLLLLKKMLLDYFFNFIYLFLFMSKEII